MKKFLSSRGLTSMNLIRPPKESGAYVSVPDKKQNRDNFPYLSMKTCSDPSLDPSW